MTAVLYVTVVLCWSFTWYAIKMQLGLVSPEVSILWRFALSAALLWIGLAASGRLKRVPASRHRWFAAMGLCLFCLNFVMIYRSERFVASGVVSVIFTLSTVFNIINARLFNRVRPSARTILGAGLGVGGVALLFGDTLADLSAGTDTLSGIACAITGTLIFSFGNILATRASGDGVDLPNAIVRAMTWGVAFLLMLVLLLGRPIILDPSPRYLLSLSFLSVFGTIIAFLAYATLLARIGPARAAYASVLFPIIALTVSTLSEGYQWTLWALIGAPLALAGNAVIFTEARPATGKAQRHMSRICTAKSTGAIDGGAPVAPPAGGPPAIRS
jgi:drug/metabolite transporter (DMT)-like permease